MDNTFVFGFGGSDNATPCLFIDMGIIDRAKYLHDTKEIELFTGLTVDDVSFLIVRFLPYGFRAGGGYPSLHYINQVTVDQLRQLNTTKLTATNKRHKTKTLKQNILDVILRKIKRGVL